MRTLSESQKRTHTHTHQKKTGIKNENLSDATPPPPKKKGGEKRRREGKMQLCHEPRGASSWDPSAIAAPARLGREIALQRAAGSAHPGRTRRFFPAAGGLRLAGSSSCWFSLGGCWLRSRFEKKKQRAAHLGLRGKRGWKCAFGLWISGGSSPCRFLF